MKKRMLPCEICGREVAIRSGIRKEGSYKGKKCCGVCKKKFDSDDSKKGRGDFFGMMIRRLSENPYCENCGCVIDYGYMGHSNIAHILSKGRYKSVSVEPLNILFLCAGKNDREHLNCHHKFDNDIKNRPLMPVFGVVKERYEKFKHKVKEQGVEREIIDRHVH